MVLRPELGTYISVCSGAGGLDLGVRMALPGARTVCFVEHEIPACEILAARIADGAMDEAPIWTDLHTFDGRPWRGRVAGIVGGYPCQPFSVAGKRLGTEDPRHLWPAIERLIDTVAPLWCVFENVPNHLNLGYYDVVKPGLEGLGFRVKEGLVTASEVGASHRRQRLFILAVANAGYAEWARWLEDAEGSSRQPCGEPSPQGSALANTGYGQLPQPRRQPEGGDGAGPAGPVVLADATSGGQRERRQSSRRDGQPLWGDQPLADPNSTRRPEAGAGYVEHAGGEPQAGRGTLADAGSEGFQGGERGGAPAEGHRASPHGQASELRGVPVFAPGPGDAAAWRAILAERPDLAPALTQSEFRGMADGVAARLDKQTSALGDLSRTQKLRLTGNGVVPAQAELAVRYLARQMAEE